MLSDFLPKVPLLCIDLTRRVLEIGLAVVQEALVHWMTDESVYISCYASRLSRPSVPCIMVITFFSQHTII